MLLNLINFKSYKDFTITIPDTGLVMLDGPSGAGKSTLLEALAFLFFDEKDSTIYPRTESKGSTSVKGEFKDYTIFRQKRSDLFQITINGTVLVGLSAENWIKEKLGSADFWFASSYMRQGSKWHFLELTSIEKCNLLQELSGLDENLYQQITAKLLSKVNETQSKLDSLIFESRVQEQLYLTEYQSLPSEHATWPKEHFVSMINKYQLKKDILGSLQIWYQNQRGSILTLLNEARLNHNHVKENLLIDQRIKQYDESCPEYYDVMTLEKELESGQRSLYLAEKLQEQSQLNRLLEEYETYHAPEPLGISRQVLERWSYLHSGPDVTDLKSVSQRIKSALRYQEVKKKQDSYQQLLTKYQGITVDPIADPSDQITMLTSQLSLIDLQKEQYHCPACGVSLYLHQRKLQTTQHNMDSDHTKQLLFQAKQQQTKYHNQIRNEAERKRLHDMIKEYIPEELPEITPEVDLPSVQLQRDLYGIETLIKEHEAITLTIHEIEREKHNQDFKLRRQQLEPKIATLRKVVAQIQVEGLTDTPEHLLKQCQSLKTLIVQNKKKNEERSRILTTIETLKQQKKPIRDLESIEDLESKLASLDSEYQEMSKQLTVQIKLMSVKKLKAAYDALKKEEEAQGTRLAALKKIQTTLVYAEYFILDTVITKINNKINSILEKIFKEDISVHLRAIRKLKTADRIKPEVNLNITFQGHPVKSLKGLSGGQQARVQLACCLALAKYNKSPYLLLDECLANLDATSREHVVDEIRNVFLKEPRLILMANQDTTEGVYDEVIRL